MFSSLPEFLDPDRRRDWWDPRRNGLPAPPIDAYRVVVDEPGGACAVLCGTPDGIAWVIRDGHRQRESHVYVLTSSLELVRLLIRGSGGVVDWTVREVAS